MSCLVSGVVKDEPGGQGALDISGSVQTLLCRFNILKQRSSLMRLVVEKDTLIAV